MNIFTLGSDGKLYLARRSPAQLARTRALVHQLACQEGLSRREVRKRLVDFGIWRSVGSISQDLSRYECDRCATTPAAPASASSASPEAYAWR